MKAKLNPNDLRKLNLTMAIEKATGFNYVGEGRTQNAVTKTDTVYELFESDDKMYVLVDVDKANNSVELKPKNFKGIKATFELLQ